MYGRIRPLNEVPRVNNFLGLADLNPEDAEIIKDWVLENIVSADVAAREYNFDFALNRCARETHLIIPHRAFEEALKLAGFNPICSNIRPHCYRIALKYDNYGGRI